VFVVEQFESESLATYIAFVWLAGRVGILQVLGVPPTPVEALLACWASEQINALILGISQVTEVV